MTVMHQKWRHLLLAHWEVPHSMLRELVPASLEIDQHEGKCYVSLVPFTLEGVRPPFTPALPFVSSFHEVNVRTYVTHQGADPGVWFFSLDASSLLAVEAAILAYHLPYHHADIDFAAARTEQEDFVFNSKRRTPGPAACAVSYRPTGPRFQATPGTLDFFLVERYLLYAASGAVLRRARVHHDPYPIHRAEADIREETLLWAAGIRKPPATSLLHYSEGVDVEIDAPERAGKT